ncbi:Sulfotransferase domain-containing protein [Alcanivorax sp. DSM 26293]|uniref:sulfotransferase domain-containing protein n=1 Tax=Alcanivorax sp. DSM 26293 TaxID=1798238 RepID=UPI0008A02293|nr:sulfotransferase domain-containing protein [Alcanivorax sp. DSM 26293]SEF40151.1 Sulfotransferase domain-containing protein [Alcanivorax sp. DSM 26293]
MFNESNLFIVGAPKCGTTTLAYWLSQHEEIFMPAIKEPHFYNTDSNHRVITVRSDYLKLYSSLESESANYRLDASVWYLYSEAAIRNIEEENRLKKARYIVCLRNPVEMAPSLHQELFMGGSETVKNFREAWSLQDNRAQGKDIPPSSHEPKHLIYRDICSLGKYTQRLMSMVADSERVFFVTLDEMRESPRATLEEIFSFLNLEAPRFPVNLDVKNEARKPKYYLLDNLYKKLLALRYKYFSWLPSLGFLRFLKKGNVSFEKGKINALSDQEKQALTVFFQEDMALLSKITGKKVTER